VAAGVLSGGPSTLIALAKRENLLDSTRAAGTLLGRRSVVRGLLAHVGLTVGWTAVLAIVLPRRRPIAEGVAAGAVIAVVSMGLGRRYPDLRRLDAVPQVLDNLAFGVVASVFLSSAPTQPGRHLAMRARHR
jgi:hypothetical protein